MDLFVFTKSFYLSMYMSSLIDLFVFTKSFYMSKVIKHAVDVDADPSRFPSNWLFHVKRGKKPGDFNGKYQGSNLNINIIFVGWLVYRMPITQCVPS
jgi:hypothetical protein